MPDDDGDATAELAARGVLPIELVAELRAWIRFRDILLHEFVDVDDSVVRRRLQDHVALSAFLAALAGWLRRP